MNKVLIPKKGNSTFTMLYVKTGSRNEPENIKGISHFIEHMLFKGTKTKTAKQIAYSIEKYGANLNAWTDYELTAYWIKSANKYKKDAESILMDMLHNSFFPQVEIDKERNVIIQEMKMYDDNPSFFAWETFYKALFNKTDGLHMPIIGSRRSLDNINRETLLNYYKNNYKNLTLVQIGDVEECVDIDKSEKLVLPPTCRVIQKTEANDILVVKKKGVTQANVIIGGVVYPGGSNRLDKDFNLEILKGVFNDMSGRLFSKVREEHNLCYRVAFGVEFLSCGSYIWSVQLGLEKDKIDLAYNLIMEELTRQITDKELDYAKTKKIGKKALVYDNISTMATKIAYSDVLGMDYNEQLFNYEKRFKNVKDINQFVKSLNFEDNIMVQVIPEEK